MYGKELDNNVLILNASDDRGISTIRNIIIKFAKLVPSNKKNIPNFKLIILDEADAMTSEAQSALRKIIESSAHITRFCFICNYIDKIIYPIVSRCMLFRFNPIDKKFVVNKLKNIAEIEKFDINNTRLNLIAELSEGDIRKAITQLQNLKYIDNNTINDTDVFEMMGEMSRNNKLISQIWNVRKYSINRIHKLVEDFKRYGIPYVSILSYIHEYLLECDLNDLDKSELALLLSQIDKRINDGTNEYIQILNMLIKIKMINTIN